MFLTCANDEVDNLLFEIVVESFDQGGFVLSRCAKMVNIMFLKECLERGVVKILFLCPFGEDVGMCWSWSLLSWEKPPILPYPFCF